MQSEQTMYQKQNYGVGDFPVRIFHLQTKESGKDLKGKEADCFISSQLLRKRKSLSGFLWKMFPDYLIVKKERILEASSPRWMNSGMAYRGECWTQNFSEHPKDVEESILSQVIEVSAPLKYFLNKEQLQSLINRAEARNTPMPQELREKIELQITTLSNMPELDEYLRRDPKQKDTGMTERLIRLIQEEAPMLYVRRMMPLEYERLQGFPVVWTQVDGEV